jgi:hypothetical protein
MPVHVTPKAERTGPQSARLTLEDGSIVEVSRAAERVTFEAERGGSVVGVSIDEAGFTFALGVLFPALGALGERWSFDFEEKGAHVEVTVRAGTPGSRALAGKLTLRPDEADELRRTLGSRALVTTSTSFL